MTEQIPLPHGGSRHSGRVGATGSRARPAPVPAVSRSGAAHRRNVFYNLDGTVARTFSPALLEGGFIQNVFAISVGPYAGDFGYLTGNGNELVIFSLP